MIALTFPRLYNIERKAEPCSIGFPVPRGKITSSDGFAVTNAAGEETPAQSRVTGRWPDGSVKWIFTTFHADLMSGCGAEYFFRFDKRDRRPFEKIQIEGTSISSGALKAELAVGEDYVFKTMEYGKMKFEHFLSVPSFENRGKRYALRIDRWETVECGEVYAVLRGSGSFGGVYDGGLTLKFYKDKSWFEVAVRLVNTTDEEMYLTGWQLGCETGAGDGSVRTMTARSNYRTKYRISDTAQRQLESIDAEDIISTANEHNPEVFYGTFFADTTDSANGTGICATVYQAFQNYPKAVCAERDALTVYLVPEGREVRIEHSMALTQRFLLHLHDGLSPEELNDRSTMYQMPDRPYVSPDVFEESGVYPGIFTKKPISDAEIFLAEKADEHNRCYGMPNWGDSADWGYTEQGRGGGEIVWSNNEYDYTHACAMMYARSGVRRYLDYCIASARHWMDADICHYSSDPMKLHGQYEHTNRHNAGGKVAISHQWVEGLFDYYHLTGDSSAYDAAMGIADNVSRNLDAPKFKSNSETSARETGWALRTLTAVYLETNDESRLSKCDFIVDHFARWEQEKGHWLSKYLDNVSIRVVFMISVAVVSLMRYNRVRPQKRIEDMIIRAVDDMLENCRLDNGLFYYKELPSLDRLGNNPIILEALSAAYEITGDTEYLKAGLPTFRHILRNQPTNGTLGKKRLAEGCVITGSAGTKSFAQMMPPLTRYYTCASQCGLL